MNLNIPAMHSNPSRLSPCHYSVVQGGKGRDRSAAPKDDPRRNRLLASLPEAQYKALLPHLQKVDMHAGEVVYQFGNRSQYVYFPATSIVSLVYEVEDGASAEVAIVGNEGMVGIGQFMAGETMPGLAQVQCTGHGYRLSSRILKQECDVPGPLQHALLCYAQALMVEIAQNAVCSRHHSIKQQLCRCLLSNLDRSEADELPLTHEMLGVSLGVRRECVTGAAGKLRAEGLIEYKRGHVHVVDRDGLEAESCECYDVVRRTFERLLPAMPEVRTQAANDTRFTGQFRAVEPRSRVHAGHLRTQE